MINDGGGDGEDLNYVDGHRGLTLWEADDDDKGNVVDDDVDDDTDADNCVDDEDTCEEAGKSNNQFVSVCCSVTLCNRSPGWWSLFYKGEG